MAERGLQGLNHTPRRGDIQGLRAIAVLLVVVYHSGVGLPGGFIGVDVFFVISGYVITKMLTTELDGTGRFDLKRFYLRRIRRLLPALGLMLSVVMVASVLLAPIGGQQVTAHTGAAAALLNANTYLIHFGGDGYFDVSAEVNALLHTWSLSVEEQFYLVFPALFLGSWALGRRWPRMGSLRAAAVALSLIAGTSFMLSWALTTGRTEFLPVNDLAQEFAFYSSTTRAWEFAVGGLLALASSRLVALGVVASTLSAAVGVLLVLLASIYFDGGTPFPGTAALLPVVGTLLILLAGEGPIGNPLNRALAVRPATFLGDLSYSWYLWHWPCIVFAAALWPAAAHTGLIAAAASLIPAAVSYHFVENPIRFAQRPPARRTLALAVVCIAVPLASAVVLKGGHRSLQRSDTVVEFDRAFRQHADADADCDSTVPLGKRDVPGCTWTVEDPIGLAVLVGDSNAGQYSEAFVGAANAAGLDATVATLSSCPFVDLIGFRGGVLQDQCRSFVTQTLQSLIDIRPEFVVIASASDHYITSDSRRFQSSNTAAQSSTAIEKEQLWTGGLVRVIEPLQAAGVEVVIVHPQPKFPRWDPRECAVARVLLSSRSCGTTMNLADADRNRAPAVSAESAAAAATSAKTLDVASFLCPEERCSTQQGSTWTWRDDGHISVDASILLEPVFGELF